MLPEDMANVYVWRVNKILDVEYTSPLVKQICISMIKLLQNEVSPKRARYYNKVIKQIEAMR